MCLNGASTCRLAAIVAAVLLCVVGGPLLLAGAVLFSQGGPKTETAERGNNFLIGLTLLVVGTVLLIVGVVLLMLLCCTGVFDDDRPEHQVEEKDRPQERPIIVHTTIVREKRVLRLSKKVKPNPLMQDIGTSDNCQQTDIEQKAKKHKERTFANRSVNSTPRGFHDEFHRSKH
ncbi:hypothetical protein CAPTEDRAFT_206385 [Capitella teleta]|uniref:DUF4190 domain-containing protein n=1 Tax=Capitella teleta TaxID=283909 RepID=R7T8L1_CAPTE|nr:hypothetical protein CAPTEDRAFT_206385 [Capitella teleta]|eukprot:ELT90014.1 hypothetical protein CAPTEDRAFT_206385 [Capitella teleta]